IDGHISELGPRIAGTVTRVLVEENARVRAGQPLVELDPQDYRVALERAEAELAQAEAQVAASSPQPPITATTNQTAVAPSSDEVGSASAAVAAAERDQESAVARLEEARAVDEKARIDLRRARLLVSARAVPVEQLDDRVAAARSAAAGVR